MSARPATTTDPAVPPPTRADRRPWRLERPGEGTTPWRHAVVALPLTLSLVFNTASLSQNGYANTFYSAAVRSMLVSLHNFWFVSFDTGGLVSVDKPPLALWVQATSAKIFGFGPLSLLLPEAIAGALTVLVVYVLLARRLGVLAGLAGALALATYPTFVAVSRDNGVDPLLVLLMALACATAVRACETGRWRSLLACAALVGLAFNTKTLAAYLVVPGIAAGFLACAPGSLRRRLIQLGAATLVMGTVSFAWIASVEATPAGKRPYVGSSTDDTELNLTFAYNGTGRVEGQAGGPNGVRARPGAYVPPSRLKHNPPGARRVGAPPSIDSLPAVYRPARTGVSGPKRSRLPIPFGPSPGLLRLFGRGLGAQIGWLLPLAALGLLGIALLVVSEHGPDVENGERLTRLRRDRRTALLIVLGGWFAVEAAVLSLSKGIVHPYYVSALAPGAAAMAGGGIVALARVGQARGRLRLGALALAALGVAATVVVQAGLMHREQYHFSFVPVLAACAALGLLAAVSLRRATTPALAAVFCLLLVVPSAFASTTWLAPVEGTFPVAGEKELAGHGGVGLTDRSLAIYLALMGYARQHDATARFPILTVSADAAAPFILMGMRAGSVAGYSGTDPALSGPGLARLVARGQARYVLLGGEYAMRGGNGATRATLRACRQLASFEWGSPEPYPFGLVLFDCAGRARRLAQE